MQLRVKPSFRQLNIEFIYCFAIIVLYHYGDYLYFYGNLDLEQMPLQIYKICSRHSTVYFYLYGLFAVYWARAYIKRSEYIIDALRAVTSQKFISKSSLSIILELIKLLFDVRESIQESFGPMLFMIISLISLQSAESIFGVIHKYERDPAGYYNWLAYLMWLVTLSIEFACIFAFFTKIGGVVSKYRCDRYGV